MKPVDYNVYNLKIIKELKLYMRKNNLEAVNSKLPKFVFLCGKARETNDNRSLVTELYKNHRHDIICIYVESLWDLIDNREMDLLTFEEFLAELCDGIVIFVESFGTACELGAFTIKDSIMKKILVFNDTEHRNSKSFINDGPIKKVLADNPSNVIYCDMKAIFSNPLTFSTLVNFIPSIKKCSINKEEKGIRLDAFVIEFLELLYLLGPIKLNDLMYVYKKLKDFSSYEFCLKKVEARHVEIFLQLVGFITKDENGYLKLKKAEYQYTNFMLKMDLQQRNKVRSKILTRMYHFKKGIIA